MKDFLHCIKTEHLAQNYNVGAVTYLDTNHKD